MTRTKVSIIFLILMLISVFSGCSNENGFLLGYEVSPYVKLFDYKSLTIDKDFITVSDDEIKMVIEADLDSKGIYKEVTDRIVIENGDIILCDIVSDIAEYNLSDYFFFTDSNVLQEDLGKNLIGMKKGDKISFSSDETENSVYDSTIYIKEIYTFAQADDEELVLNMYSCDSMEDVYDYVRVKTENTIILNYALDKILENSYIKNLPKQAEEYVKKKEEIKNQYGDDKEFEDYIGMSLEEYREYNYNTYFEYMIYSAIAEAEKLVFTDADFDATVTQIANAENLSAEDVAEIFDFEYIVFETIADEVENAITSYVVAS